MNRNMSELLIKNGYQHVTKKNKPSKKRYCKEHERKKRLKR